MNKEILFKTFRNTTGAAIYIFLVSQVMQNGERLFGGEDNMFTPFAILLLFSLSAGVVGFLVFGNSLMLFLDNKKKESVAAAIYSIAWLGLYTLLAMFTLFLLKI